MNIYAIEAKQEYKIKFCGTFSNQKYTSVSIKESYWRQAKYFQRKFCYVFNDISNVKSIRVTTRGYAWPNIYES